MPANFQIWYQFQPTAIQVAGPHIKPETVFSQDIMYTVGISNFTTPNTP